MRTSADAEGEHRLTNSLPDNVEELLSAWHSGDEAAFDRLFSLLYEDLHRMARHFLRVEREGHTLNTMDLVHEAYVRLAMQSGRPSRNRAQFLAFVARAMRHILVDYARRRRAGKRGGNRVQVTLQTDMGVQKVEALDLLALDEALEKLATLDPRLRVVVECRFFGGMSPEEIAQALGITRRTVDRDWIRARAYLYQLLHPQTADR